jgi:DtxR family manganese transport transcriptional regulator
MPVKKSISARHQRTRQDHAQETAEDYAEAVDDLVRTLGRCRVTDLAKRFAVSHVTALRTVARLQRDGLVTTEPYGPIELTEQGLAMASAARDRHRVVYAFLIAIGVPEAVAAIDSEGIEHHCSQQTLERMQSFLSSGNRVGPADSSPSPHQS